MGCAKRVVLQWRKISRRGKGKREKKRRKKRVESCWGEKEKNVEKIGKRKKK